MSKSSTEIIEIQLGFRRAAVVCSLYSNSWQSIRTDKKRRIQFCLGIQGALSHINRLSFQFENLSLGERSAPSITWSSQEWMPSAQSQKHAISLRVSSDGSKTTDKDERHSRRCEATLLTWQRRSKKLTSSSEISGRASGRVRDLFNGALECVRSSLFDLQEIVENDFSKAFATKSSSFVEYLKLKGYRVFRANALKSKMNTVETHLKDASSNLWHLIGILANAVKTDSRANLV